MSKKISCRVIKSVPLYENSDVFADASHSGKKQHNVGEVAAGNNRAGEGGNSIRDRKGHTAAFGELSYTCQSGAAKISVDNGLTRGIVDCYL